jgi:hypothetical protein
LDSGVSFLGFGGGADEVWWDSGGDGIDPNSEFAGAFPCRAVVGLVVQNVTG